MYIVRSWRYVTSNVYLSSSELTTFNRINMPQHASVYLQYIFDRNGPYPDDYYDIYTNITALYCKRSSETREII